MGAITCEMELPSILPAAKMFKAFVLESDHLFPKIMPQAIKSVENVEGDGGAGTIKKVNLVDGDKSAYVKHKIDAIDKENFLLSYSIIEGDILVNKFEKICYETKWVPSPDGGSICKSSIKYYTLPGFEIPEEQLINSGKEKSALVIKAVEVYLQANPDAC